MITDIKDVYIGFDIGNRYIRNLLGYDIILPSKPTYEFEGDFGFYCYLFLNAEKNQANPYTNTLEVNGIGFEFTLKLEATEQIIYNLIQMAWNNQLANLDGEIKALNLPESIPSFQDYWDQPTNIFDEVCRKGAYEVNKPMELRPTTE